MRFRFHASRATNQWPRNILVQPDHQLMSLKSDIHLDTKLEPGFQIQVSALVGVEPGTNQRSPNYKLRNLAQQNACSFSVMEL